MNLFVYTFKLLYSISASYFTDIGQEMFIAKISFPFNCCRFLVIHKATEFKRVHTALFVMNYFLPTTSFSQTKYYQPLPTIATWQIFRGAIFLSFTSLYLHCLTPPYHVHKIDSSPFPPYKVKRKFYSDSFFPGRLLLCDAFPSL